MTSTDTMDPAAASRIRELLPERCELCPRRCGANRRAGERGVCGADDRLLVARAALHEWEEPVVSAGAGSGTVFFSNCPLRCIYCQNREIACGAHGRAISLERLSEIFLELAAQGAANVNLVTPTHYAPLIAASLRAARERGLGLPVLCNTSGYELPEAIRALDGLVDGYLTDFKYAPGSDAARRYSHAPDYAEVALAGLEAMVESVGEPRFHRFAGERALASGTIVRHLVLPGRAEESIELLTLLWRRFGESVLYSIMSQYTPLGEHPQAPELDRRVEDEEYERVLDALDALGCTEYFWQEGGAAEESFIPPFDLTGVERAAGLPRPLDGMER